MRTYVHTCVMCFFNGSDQGWTENFYIGPKTFISRNTDDESLFCDLALKGNRFRLRRNILTSEARDRL